MVINCARRYHTSNTSTKIYIPAAFAIRLTQLTKKKTRNCLFACTIPPSALLNVQNFCKVKLVRNAHTTAIADAYIYQRPSHSLKKTKVLKSTVAAIKPETKYLITWLWSKCFSIFLHINIPLSLSQMCIRASIRAHVFDYCQLHTASPYQA